MISKTKISKGNSTIVPSEIRKRFDINPGDILVWVVRGDKIELTPRKRVTFDDIIGIIEVGGDAVEAKKRIQAGRKA